MAEANESLESLDELFARLASGASQTTSRRTPFKFLDPYGPADRDIFFGRELEIAELYSRFYKSRLLVIYGESGAGKTSLIQCGLRNAIPPEDALFLNIRSAIDPLQSLYNELQRHIAVPGNGPWTEASTLLREVAERKSKSLVLIFDQFEEFFLFQPEVARQAMIAEMAAWLSQDLKIHIIIGIREEFLARLTELEPVLPGLYQNRLWVRRMSRDHARQVVTGPCQACGVGIEPGLVAVLLDELAQGGNGVELPILQVVIDALYRQAVDKAPRRPLLTVAAYQAMGRTGSILAGFVEDKVKACANQEQVRQVLKALVTSAGTRQLSSLETIHERASQFGDVIPEPELIQILRRLNDDRLIREDAENHLIELRHDALAATIHQWMTGTEQELIDIRQTLESRLKEYQRRRVLLDRETLTYIEPYETRLRLKGELAELVEKSRRASAKKRRVWAVGSIVSASTALVVLTLAGLSFQQYREATIYQGLALNEKARLALQEKDFNSARLYSLHTLGWLNRYGIDLPNSFSSLDPLARMKPALALARAAARGRLLLPDFPVMALAGHAEDVSSVAFSPDGRWLASGSRDNTVRLWELPSGRLLPPLSGHGDDVSCVSFSQDGKLLASGSKDKSVRLWEVSSGNLIAPLNGTNGHTQEVSSVSFSPDGKLLASGSRDKTVRLWETASGQLLAVLEGHADAVTSVSFSPDGKVLASGSRDKSVRLWNVADHTQRLPPLLHEGEVLSVSFSPSGTLLAAGSSDMTARLWEVASGKELKTLIHDGVVTSLSFSHDGERLATASGNNTIRLWEVGNLRHDRVTLGINPIDMVVGNDAIPKGEVVSGVPAVVLLKRGNGVRSVSFSRDGEWLASGSKDKVVRLWRMNSRDPVMALAGHADGVRSVSFSPDGKWLASGSKDNTVGLWDAVSGERVGKLEGHQESIAGVSFSHDGRLLASGSSDKTIRLWQMPGGELVGKLGGRDEDPPVTSVSFSPDGRWLASGARDRTVRLWDVARRDLVKILGHEEGHKETVTSVSFSPDGKLLASGSSDSTIRLWRMPGGELVGKLGGREEDVAVTSISFSRNGKWLASGGRDNTVRLWDVSSRKLVATLEGHESTVSSVCFTPDDEFLASASLDRTVGLWEVASRKPVIMLAGHEGPVFSVACTSDELASGSRDLTIRVWSMVAIRKLFDGNVDRAIKDAEALYRLRLEGLELTGVSPVNQRASNR